MQAEIKTAPAAAAAVDESGPTKYEKALAATVKELRAHCRSLADELDSLRAAAPVDDAGLRAALRAAALAERYGNAIIEISKHLALGTPGGVMRARTVIAGLVTHLPGGCADRSTTDVDKSRP